MKSPQPAGRSNGVFEEPPELWITPSTLPAIPTGVYAEDLGHPNPSMAYPSSPHHPPETLWEVFARRIYGKESSPSFPLIPLSSRSIERSIEDKKYIFNKSIDHGEGEVQEGKDQSPVDGNLFPRQQLLARDLARILHDEENLAAFRALVRDHPEERLRAALSFVLDLPPEKITKSRAAYFTWLVQDMARKQENRTEATR